MDFKLCLPPAGGRRDGGLHECLAANSRTAYTFVLYFLYIYLLVNATVHPPSEAEQILIESFVGQHHSKKIEKVTCCKVTLR